jgi:hypothetical protein
MAAEFIPLISSMKANLAGTAAGAKPVSHFAPMITAPIAPKAASDAAHGTVAIDVKKEGERISQIRVQCRCGEVVEIVCEY